MAIAENSRSLAIQPENSNPKSNSMLVLQSKRAEERLVTEFTILNYPMASFVFASSVCFGDLRDEKTIRSNALLCKSVFLTMREIGSHG